MRGPPTTFWGKLQTDATSGEVLSWHPLEDHCADVAACAEALLRSTLLGRRLAALGGQTELDEGQIQRLAALAAFHDAGKYNVGFQNKARKELPTAGHVAEVAALFDGTSSIADRFVDAIGAEEWMAWGEVETVQELFFAAICHHGRPVVTGQPIASWIWRPVDGLDPFAGLRRLAERVRSWYPKAFAPGERALPSTPQFQHAFSGLVMLADWLGSDTKFFPYSEPGSRDRMEFARPQARRAFEQMGLDATPGRASLGTVAPSFDRIFGFAPKGAQIQMAGWHEPPAAASLTLLEAETGAGKTEAALQRFFHLFHQGEVDGMYFALPTRTAATQIYRRVVDAVRSAFPAEDSRPPVVLAVPGYLDVDGVEGTRAPLLGPFEVLWNDTNAERFRFRAWAAENTKRYLGACCHNDAEAQNAGILSQPTSSNRWNGPMRKVMA